MSEVRAGAAVKLRRWYCPDCERLLTKPPYRDGDSRYHSWKCKAPLVLADVFICEVKNP